METDKILKANRMIEFFVNHLSIHLPIPRFARSPYIRLLLPTSKINNHHSTLINQTGLVIGGT